MQNKEKNETFNTIYKKLTNLVSAIFLVVDSIKDNNQLRERVKSLSVELLSDFLNIKNSSLLKETNTILLKIENRCLEIKSILDIMFVSGYISESNKNILRVEFDLFVKNLNLLENFDNDIENILINEMSIKDSEILLPNNILSLNKNHSSPESLSDSSERYLSNLQKSQTRKDQRKLSIFEFIKKHKDVSIKDITPNIKGCSEKTIQRELIELIDLGQIKKVGERRWSRYMIA